MDLSRVVELTAGRGGWVLAGFIHRKKHARAPEHLWIRGETGMAMSCVNMFVETVRQLWRNSAPHRWEFEIDSTMIANDTFRRKFSALPRIQQTRIRI